MTCKLCGGLLALLGDLGILRWFRCTGCGMNFSKMRRLRRKGKS